MGILFAAGAGGAAAGAGHGGRMAAGEAGAAVLALAALVTWAAAAPGTALLPMVDAPSEDRADAAEKPLASALAGAAGWEHLIGGYGGVSLTLPSTVRLVNPGRSDLTVQGLEWIGRPFKSPIYYGLRSQHWAPGALLGGMIDFTHAKAIAAADSTASFTGTIDGRPAPGPAQVKDVFRHLEFSHGHNILTLNGLLRLPAWSLPVRPYMGVGAGITLPHTEVGLRQENARTYEYQFAGYAGQVLLGLQVPLGRSTLFIEYKFTYAPYSVPLSHEPRGWLLVTDLWRQLRAWTRAEAPPGGTLTTTLATHHGIGGVLVRTSRAQASPPAAP